mgnify:CR=1 FL=1
MKFSFLVPAYKSHYFRKALLSILSQNYDDYEVIVSDDASPENLKKIVDEIKSSKIHYHRKEHNIGSFHLVTHWNQLLSMAKGEYVIIAADDDIYEPNFLVEMERLIAKYPETDLIRARVRHIDMQDETVWEDALYPEFQDELSAICAYSTTCIGNYVFKKKTLLAKGGFVDFPYAMGSDNATVMLMAKNGMVNSKEVLFNFRISDIQVSHASKNKKIDKGKMLSEIQFHYWMKDLMDNLEYEPTKLNLSKVLEFYNQRIKGGLLYCSKMYYGALNFREFTRVFKALNDIGCFGRTIDKVMFFLDYLRSKKMYK